MDGSALGSVLRVFASISLVTLDQPMTLVLPFPMGHLVWRAHWTPAGIGTVCFLLVRSVGACLPCTWLCLRLCYSGTGGTWVTPCSRDRPVITESKDSNGTRVEGKGSKSWVEEGEKHPR